MKKYLLLALLCLAGGSATYASPPPAAGIGVSFGLFYSSLSPYGEWISVGGDLYGWRPLHVAVGWRPYTYGRWIWTDDGWYWASEEPWGWAAYHYGRWYYDDYYGWVWIPGYDWAPAWVEWRYGGDYIGWAPLSPYAVFSFSFGIHYRTHWVTPHSWWSFVDCDHMGAHDIHRYVHGHEGNDRFIGRTRDGGSVRYESGQIRTRGPGRDYVERRGNVRLERAEIVDVADRQGERVVRQSNDRERIETFRPRFSASGDRSEMTRPPAVRQSDRPLRLDTRGLDVRSREEDMARGRDIRRSEEYRQQRQLEMQQGQGRRVDPGVRTYEPRRSNRNVERAPAPRPTYKDAAPRVQQRDQLRSREPERVIRRPEYRPAPSIRSTPQAQPRQSESGRSGNARGGSGGKSRGGGNRR
jgi:hypothetical protein